MSDFTCPVCGGNMIGDGYTTVYHCENVRDCPNLEPDAEPVYCDEQKHFDKIFEYSKIDNFISSEFTSWCHKYC